MEQGHTMITAFGYENALHSKRPTAPGPLKGINTGWPLACTQPFPGLH